VQELGTNRSAAGSGDPPPAEMRSVVGAALRMRWPEVGELW
jgi:hypothetical protein